MQTHLTKILLSLSDWLDWSHNGITDHHRRVAFASLNLGNVIGLDDAELSKLFKAAIIHDIGAVTWDEKQRLMQFDVENTLPHCLRGQYLIARSRLTSHLGDTILHHHDRWDGHNHSGLAGEEIPLTSRIIHLCDRLVIKIGNDDHILNQSQTILSAIRNLSGTVFDPSLVDALEGISSQPSFWLDLVHPGVGHGLEAVIPWKEVRMNAIDLHELAGIMAYPVDAKSRFTYRHSHGVAAVTRFLAELAGLDKGKAILLETAGLLHDLGKLTVPESILEKPGPLTSQEMSWIKQHTYYTYWFLRQVGLDPSLAEWAAFHHERLDGRGYPFGKSAKDLSLEHRIVAVADIFTALREDRPYRQAMDWASIERVLASKAQSNGIDGDIVLELFAEKDALDDLWAELSARLAQQLDAMQTAFE